MRRLLILLLAIAVAPAIAGCGDALDAASSTAAAEAATAAPTVAETATATSTPRPQRRHRRVPARVALTACDANISVKASTTSCGFAQNVFAAYWAAHRTANEASFSAYSPATETDFDLNCTSADQVRCVAGDGGYVAFPMAAVQSYSEDQYDAYVCSHDTGEDACVDPDVSEEQAVPSSDDGCDPNYEGACLDPDSSDYDCEGGSGDGPDHTGMVEVVGTDVYDLDRDGDGIACDV